MVQLKRLAPAKPEVQLACGIIAEADNKIPEAISCYERALKGDPQNMTAMRNLGNMLMRQKQWDKCIRLYRNALKYHPNEPYILERLGTLLVTCPEAGLRNIPEGREYAERAFIHATSQSTTLISSGRSLAVAYASLGDFRNAYAIMKMTINLARRENFSRSRMDELESLLEQYHNQLVP